MEKQLLTQLLNDVLSEFKNGGIKDTDQTALIRRAKLEGRIELVLDVIKHKSS